MTDHKKLWILNSKMNLDVALSYVMSFILIHCLFKTKHCVVNILIKAGYSRCIIEKEVKVNIMRFRTLRSIEFQGLYSRNWNLPRSENCIFGIYGP